MGRRWIDSYDADDYFEKQQEERDGYGQDEEEPTEDTGRYESGHRIYRDGTIREDFGSDR